MWQEYKYARKLIELDVKTTRIRSRVNGVLVDKCSSNKLFYLPTSTKWFLSRKNPERYKVNTFVDIQILIIKMFQTVYLPGFWARLI